MVEGGVATADKTEFTECWRTVWKTPYIMRLALSAGIGGLLFGYDTGKKFNSWIGFISNMDGFSKTVCLL
jgi:SP family myo-inositol transporter-like MFS transporter 13